MIRTAASAAITAQEIFPGGGSWQMKFTDAAEGLRTCPLLLYMSKPSFGELQPLPVLPALPAQA